MEVLSVSRTSATDIEHYRGASRIFLRGGAEVVGAKSVEKEKLLVIRIAKEKLGGPSN